MKSSVGAGLRSLIAAALIGATFPVAFAAPQACAGEGDRAALVVDTGATEYAYCVALPDDEVSGLDLIVLANQQHGLDYRFGFGGEAVCMLAGVGADGDDCFGRYPDFWGYWRGDGAGGWQWSGTGAGSTRVGDGDVEGWAWGSGSDGSTHPAPPATSFGSVCAAAPSDPSEGREDDRRRGDDDRRKGPEGTTGAESPAAAPTTVRDDTGGRTGPAGGVPGDEGDRERAGGGARGRRSSRFGPAPATETPGGALPVSAGGEASEEAEAPPAAGLVAVAAAGLVAVAGLAARRRRRTP